MPEIGQQAPRKWVVKEGDAAPDPRDAKRAGTGGGGGPLPQPSGRHARRRRAIFAGGLLGAAFIAVTVYIVWGGGAEALGLVEPPVDPTAELDPRVKADVYKIVMAAEKMTEAQATELESGLRDRPDDLKARTQLIVFYSAMDHKAASAGTMHEKHVLWVVNNEPTAPILGTLHAQMRFPQDAYKAARKQLLSTLNAKDEDLALLRNAGTFLALHDPEVADKLFARGQALDPSNSEWSQWRGELDLRKSKKVPKTAAAAKALDAEQNELRNALSALDGKSVEVPPGNPPFSQLGDLAMNALNKGKLQEARSYAVAALRKAGDHKDSWAYGEVVHLAHAVVGHLALRVGRVDLAEKYLLLAAKTPGSPRLNARGPDLSLVKALMKKGRTESVMRYFDATKAWWTDGAQKGTLSRWMKQVKTGGQPDYTVP